MFYFGNFLWFFVFKIVVENRYYTEFSNELQILASFIELSTIPQLHMRTTNIKTTNQNFNLSKKTRAAITYYGCHRCVFLRLHDLLVKYLNPYFGFFVTLIFLEGLQGLPFWEDLVVGIAKALHDMPDVVHLSQ
jgi:hypothetical protein